jgi:phage/plasmid-like protein (TIGR03299 family)
MTTDVNTQFDTQRDAQIKSLQDMREGLQQRIAEFESGEAQAKLDAALAEQVSSGAVTMLSADRYRVNTGFDRGEIFSVRKARMPGELTLIEPESGLDYVDGVAQGLFDRPEWHSLGNVELGGICDIDKAMELSGLGFEVRQRPVRYYDDEGKIHTMPDAFVNYRSDNYEGLGVVGKIYTPVQNRDGAAFLQSLVDDFNAKIASAFPLNGGKRCVISMKMPDDVVIDADGIGDHIEMYLAWLNNHDGQGQAECVVTPWRPRCRNTERLAVKGAVTRWGTRHTKNAMERLDEARRSLQLTTSWMAKFTAEEEQLAASAATMDTVLEVMDTLWEPVTPETTKRGRTDAHNREDQLAAGWGEFSRELGSTKYAAERVFTDWYDHVAPRRMVGERMGAARATAALVGSSDKDKNKVHAKLMAMVNA